MANVHMDCGGEAMLGAVKTWKQDSEFDGSFALVVYQVGTDQHYR
jgi:hypothetical protein